MATINSVDLLNKRTKARFDITDDGYKILMAGYNSGYTLPGSGTVQPNDLNLGAVANITEYGRLLADWLIEQMSLDTAYGTNLDYLGQQIYNTYRENNESDDTYRERIKDVIFGSKETKWIILDKITQYNNSGSPTYPFMSEFEEVLDLQAYADYSYCDQYKRYYSPPSPEEVFPAYSELEGVDGIPRFFFKVYMLQVNSGDKQTVMDTIDRLKIAGVGYQVLFLDEDIYGS